MKQKTLGWVVWVTCTVSPGMLLAQGIRVDLDATGADGAINVTIGTVTYPLPESGVIQASSVTVASGATLKFSRNTRNTGVLILSQGDVTINGTITVSGDDGVVGAAGAGGPGGVNGGTPTVAPGDLRFYPRQPTWLGSPDKPWLTGAHAGRGSSSTGACVSPGSGGGGGSGTIWILSETVIRGASTGSVHALGGGHSVRLPTGGTCGTVGMGEEAQDGTDGFIRLMAPNLDAPTLVLRGQQVELHRMFTTTDPTATTGTGQVSQLLVSETMTKLPLFNPRVTVVSVDGQVTPAGESGVITLSSGNFKQVVVRLTGCAGAQATVYLSPAGQSGTGTVGIPNGAANFSNATDPQDATFELNITGPSSAFLEARAQCF